MIKVGPCAISVADTGGWLPDGLLLAPQALGHLYPEGKVLLVNLTREQIKKQPVH